MYIQIRTRAREVLQLIHCYVQFSSRWWSLARAYVAASFCFSSGIFCVGERRVPGIILVGTLSGIVACTRYDLLMPRTAGRNALRPSSEKSGKYSVAQQRNSHVACRLRRRRCAPYGAIRRAARSPQRFYTLSSY